MNVNWRRLEALAAGARLCSLTAAARLLNLSQPALTVQIRQLEETLTIRLLDRALEERYGTHDAYVARVRAAAPALVEQRFLLQEDADRLVREAEASAVLR